MRYNLQLQVNKLTYEIDLFFYVYVKYFLYLKNYNTVGIRLSALQLPETSSYQTFTSPLTEWSVKVTWQSGPFS